jgi:2,3-bisphosphoglycerate-independent phosphoglycerate mutase
MKYAIIIIDGAADVKIASLGNRTPLEAARKPAIDRIASEGICGLVKTVPDNMAPGSDVAIMSLLGNDPALYYTGRAPIEAVAKGIALKPDEWAFRCNLVTIENDIMKDHSSSNISNEEAASLISFIDKNIGTKDIRFFPGVSYRNLMIYCGDFAGKMTPPHDILGKPADEYLPNGKGSDILVNLIKKSREILPGHSINKKRILQGKNPANSIWFWGEGKAPRLESFEKRFGLSGAMIAAVDLSRGIAKLMGWDCIDVPGATGYFDTNYAGKGRAAVEALGQYDIVCVHIEAPDEAGHAGEPDEKLLAIERIDEHITKPIVEYLEGTGNPFRILVMPDHPTPCAIRTHVGDPVPFAIFGSRVKHNGALVYTEDEAEKTGLFLPSGWEMMDYFINKL